MNLIRLNIEVKLLRALPVLAGAFFILFLIFLDAYILNPTPADVPICDRFDLGIKGYLVLFVAIVVIGGAADYLAAKFNYLQYSARFLDVAEAAIAMTYCFLLLLLIVLFMGEDVLRNIIAISMAAMAYGAGNILIRLVLRRFY